MVFEIYHEHVELELQSDRTKFNRILQFSLNKDNLDLYADINSRTQICNKAGYFRHLFEVYCNQPKYKRELALCSKTVQLINIGIQNAQKLKIKYKNEIRAIEPYFITNSDGETRNYLFCYCEHSVAYRNYRLINIHVISVLREKVEKYEAAYINIIKKNFDPFLSYGLTVKVRLTPRGQKILHKIVTNKPKVVAQENDCFTFECSHFKAQLYFPQFLEEAEVLEPTELKEWFRLKFAKAHANYNKSQTRI